MKLPYGIINKNYDKEQWLGAEIVDANWIYRNNSFWDKYGSFVIMGLFLVTAIIMITLAAQFLTTWRLKPLMVKRKLLVR